MIARLVRRRPPPPPGIETVAAVTERLAVLLAAGVTPAAAWTYLGAGSTDPIVRRAVAAAVEGESVAPAIAGVAGVAGDAVTAGAWRGLAAAWFVATESGAPLAQSLRDLAASFRSLGQTQRDLAVALAGPAATARMVMALPVIGVLFGMGLGFNTLQTLFATVPGLICLGVGAALMVLGGHWNRRMIRAARPRNATPGLPVDLMAIAMTGGGSVDRARSIVGRASAHYGVVGGDETVIDGVLALAQRAGVPAAELLRSEAEQHRRQARSDGQRAAAALAVWLMAPLGVCVLPAFMLVGVAPLLMAIVSSTVATF
ncbi:MAG: tight adherence protein [Microbacteriaceae bacterium]|jgi:tight adherence protein B|nr:tight adherence protein [Microbacteriaceae bacterium]